jgi:hypothetical protein
MKIQIVINSGTAFRQMAIWSHYISTKIYKAGVNNLLICYLCFSFSLWIAPILYDFSEMKKMPKKNRRVRLDTLFDRTKSRADWYFSGLSNRRHRPRYYETKLNLSSFPHGFFYRCSILNNRCSSRRRGSQNKFFFLVYRTRSTSK